MKRKKLLSLVLALILILPCITSCKKKNDTPSDTTAPSSSETSSDSSKTDPSDDEFKITLSDLDSYAIVRPEEMPQSSVNIVVDLKKKLEDATSKQSITIKDDYVNKNTSTENNLEILVGDTNRPETESVRSSLRYDDYAVCTVGKKIVVYGFTDDTLAAAVDLFVEKVKDSAKLDLFFTSAQSEIVKADYDERTILIGDTNIKEFKVIYPKNSSNSENTVAQDLALTLSLLSGYKIYVSNDKDTKKSENAHEILVGETNRDVTPPSDLGSGESYIEQNNGSLILSGGAYLGIRNAADALLNMINNNSENKKEITINLTSPIRQTIDVGLIKAMSFNIWVSQRTEEREERVITLIKNYMPDVIGIQEASTPWVKTLKNNLTEYACVGLSREGTNTGEHNLIFYRKDEFTLLEWGTKWLSDTPDTVSKYEGSKHNRIFTYAVLKRNSDGMTFVHVNTHLDNTTDEVRAKQALSLMNSISSLSEKYPLILTGDFNTHKDSEPYNNITSAGMINASSLAKDKYGSGTYHGFSGSANSAIDFFFVNSNVKEVIKHRVCDDKINGDYPSDHYPIYVELIPN